MANPRKRKRRKKGKRRKGAPKPAAAPKRRKRAAPRKRKTTKRRSKKRTAKKRKTTMAKKARKKGGRRRRKQSAKQRAASLKNLAKGRRKRARKSGGRRRKAAATTTRRRRRRVSSGTATRRRRRKGGARKGRRHTKWGSIKAYKRKATVRRHRRRTNPNWGELAGSVFLAGLGGVLGILAKRGSDKFMPASVPPVGKGAIEVLGGAIIGGGAYLLGAPSLGLGFVGGMVAGGGDRMADEVLGPAQLPAGSTQSAAFAMGPAPVGAVVDMGAIVHDTQIEAVIDPSELGAIYESDGEGGFLEFADE